MAKIICVSSFNGKINWELVAEAGVKSAIIRCGYGKNLKKQDDKQFVNNLNGALENGISVSAFLYSYATDEASADNEADHVLRLLDDYKDKIDTVYIACLEEGTEEASKIVADTFCSIVEEYGYKTGICSSLSRFIEYLSDIPQAKRWVVAWDRKDKPDIPYHLWEYTSKGEVFGITTDVQLIEDWEGTPERTVTVKKTVEPKKEKVVAVSETTDTEIQYKVISSSGLNVRSDAGKNNPVVVTFPRNFVLTFGGDKKKIGAEVWYKVTGTINGVAYTGYCISSFLQAV